MVGASAQHGPLGAVAIAAAAAGGRAALRHFRRADLTVEWKADESPVTVADREAEAACQAVIAAAFPGDAWLGEEGGETVAANDSRRRWICDPIDGTRNFVRGVPLWATLVACEETLADGTTQVIAGAVAIPALGEMYDAVRGAGARLNGQTIRVSAAERFDQALWCYETPGWFRAHGLTRVFDELCARTALQRGFGDAYGHMLVASGRAELVIEPQLSVWDVAATSIVVEEAGGRFSDLAGTPSIRSNNAVISNGRLHAEALALISKYRG